MCAAQNKEKEWRKRPKTDTARLTLLPHLTINKNRGTYCGRSVRAVDRYVANAPKDSLRMFLFPWTVPTQQIKEH